MSEIVWREDSGLTITASDQADNALIRYLSSVPFGTQGTPYWRLNIAEQMARFERPIFLSLRDDQKVIGSYVLDRQSLVLEGQDHRALYRGLLSIHPERRNAGLGRELATRSLRWARANEPTESPALSYGVVDSNNTHSLSLLRALGMQPIGRLCSMLEYHQWRGKGLSGSNLSPTMTEDARAAWQQQYSTDGLRPRQPVDGSWLTVSDGNGNIAACRHNPTELRLGPIGGIAGFVVEKMMPFFPPGRRRFNPERFRYVSIADVVAPEGSEALWRKLVAHLMNLHDTHFVMFTLDPDSATTSRLRDAGVIGKLAWRTRTELQVMAEIDDVGTIAPTTVHISAKDL